MLHLQLFRYNVVLPNEAASTDEQLRNVRRVDATRADNDCGLKSPAIMIQLTRCDCDSPLDAHQRVYDPICHRPFSTHGDVIKIERVFIMFLLR